MQQHVSCLIYPRKQTCAVHSLVSAMGHKQTHAVRQRFSAKGNNRTSPVYSINSSARPDNGSGTATPSALAAFKLMINSTLLTCWTGRSAGLSTMTRPRDQM